MKAYISDRHKMVRFLTDNVDEACHMGTRFARDYPDLAGWTLVAHRTSENLSREDRREVDVFGARALAKFIYEAPAPQPSGFVGPFGEGK